MRLAFGLGLMIITSVILGCGATEPTKAPPPIPVGFTADEAASGPMVFLRGRVEQERVVIEVIARGAADLHGAAFRLHWDTAKLAFIEARSSDAWSRQAVVLAKEGSAGELVVAWTEKGSGRSVDAREETSLGSIDFTVKTHESAALAFRADRSMLLDSKGAPVTVAWRGGHVAAR